MSCELEVFHLPCHGGLRFCLLTRPHGPARGSILYAHPFAEELNKSRRMAALGARALAEDGWAVLQMDLLGCGDSDGSFSDGDWEIWSEDLAAAAVWLHKDSPGPLWLWGLRAGGLLASRVAGRVDGVDGLLLWQPVMDGRQHLTQFLRLAAARHMLEHPAEAVSLQKLREALAAGEAPEVAGYVLSPRLAAGLELADWNPLPPGCRVVAFEVRPSQETGLSPMLQRLTARWRDAGVAVHTEAVPGSAFWSAQEIEVCPALVERSVACLGRMP